MTATITTREFDLIRQFIEKETSISLAEDKVYLVETRLREIMREERIEDFSALHQELVSARNLALKDRVLDAMTTNETLWFRDSLPFEVFKDHLLPAYASEIRQGKRRKIRIWSAACSTGQEPYSMVMTFLEAARLNSALNLDQLEILATDYSDKALAKAKQGVYGSMAMSRGMPDGYQEKYFHQTGNEHQVKRELQDRIVFRKFNLQDSFIMQGTFDIILTRYVLIYFSDDFKLEVLSKAHGVLENGGVLFVGSSESLPEKTEGFTTVRSGRATYYQKISGKTPQKVRAPLTNQSPVSAVKPVSGKSNTDALEKATVDLAEIVKQLQKINAKHKADK